MNGASPSRFPENEPRSLRVALISTAIFVAACGGSGPSPSDATAAAPSVAVTAPPPAPAASDSAPAPAPPAAPESTAQPASAPPEQPASTEPVATRSVGDRLFARTMAYMLNYGISPAKEKVAQACAKKSGDDAAALAACVEKERAKLVSDVLVFEKGEKGSTWRTYKRVGNNLTEITVAQVEVGTDTPEKIELKIKSETGPRQLFAGKKQIVILSESDSSVAVDDPQLGKLIYEARVGLMNQ